jgi:hypothetical protein
MSTVKQTAQTCTYGVGISDHQQKEERWMEMIWPAIILKVTGRT